jgi:hypothetical protein
MQLKMLVHLASEKQLTTCEEQLVHRHLSQSLLAIATHTLTSTPPSPPLPAAPPKPGEPAKLGAPPKFGKPPKLGAPAKFGEPPKLGLPAKAGLPPKLGLPAKAGLPPKLGLPAKPGVPPKLGLPAKPGAPAKLGLPAKPVPPANAGAPATSGAPPMPSGPPEPNSKVSVRAPQPTAEAKLNRRHAIPRFILTIRIRGFDHCASSSTDPGLAKNARLVCSEVGLCRQNGNEVRPEPRPLTA